MTIEVRPAPADDEWLRRAHCDVLFACAGKVVRVNVRCAVVAFERNEAGDYVGGEITITGSHVSIDETMLAAIRARAVEALRHELEPDIVRCTACRRILCSQELAVEGTKVCRIECAEPHIVIVMRNGEETSLSI